MFAALTTARLKSRTTETLPCALSLMATGETKVPVVRDPRFRHARACFSLAAFAVMFAALTTARLKSRTTETLPCALSLMATGETKVSHYAFFLLPLDGGGQGGGGTIHLPSIPFTSTAPPSLPLCPISQGRHGRTCRSLRSPLRRTCRDRC